MLRVLIADDDEPLARALELYLERLGFSPTVCNSAQDIRETVENATSAFDFALIDYQLGKDCGAEMSEWLLNAFPHMRLVLMSGYPEDSITQVEALGNRAIFLQKPFHPRDVISCLRTLNPMLAMRL